eukprot:1381718-Amorphochlora_amoeboformis.AAC.1
MLWLGINPNLTPSRQFRYTNARRARKGLRMIYDQVGARLGYGLGLGLWLEVMEYVIPRYPPLKGSSPNANRNPSPNLST